MDTTRRSPCGLAIAILVLSACYADEWFEPTGPTGGGGPPPPPTQLDTIRPSPELVTFRHAGDRTKVYATSLDYDGRFHDYSTFTWKSENEAVVRVENIAGYGTASAIGNADFVAVGEGTTSVLVSALGKTSRIRVSVWPASALTSWTLTQLSGKYGTVLPYITDVLLVGDTLYATTGSILKAYIAATRTWHDIPTPGFAPMYLRPVPGGGVHALERCGRVMRINGLSAGMTAGSPLGALDECWADFWPTSPTSGVVANGPRVATYQLGVSSWQWAALPPGDNRAVWASGPDDIFVVGLFGRIAHYDGSAWVSTPMGTAEHLFAVWGTGPDNVFAAGNPGATLRYDGHQWRPLQVNRKYPVSRIRGRGPTDVLFVTGDCEMFRFNGAEMVRVDASIMACDIESRYDVSTTHYAGAVGWGKNLFLASTTESTPEFISSVSEFAALDVASASHAVIVGAFGEVQWWNGSTWRYDWAGTVRSLVNVFTTGADFTVATDGLGVHVHDGVRWTKVYSTSAGYSLSDVWASGPNDIWAVGEVLVHYDGTDWKLMSHGYATAVWGRDARDVFIASGSNFKHWDGVTLQDMPDQLVNGQVTRFFEIPGDAVYAVARNPDPGSSGLVRLENGQWIPVPGGGHGNDGWGTGTSDIYFAGDGGILRFDGISTSSVLGGSAIGIDGLPALSIAAFRDGKVAIARR